MASSVKDEDRRSFEVFVTASGPSLFRTACLLTGDRREAEDLLQAAFERTLRRWGRSSLRDPEAYVRTAMINAARSRWRPRRFHMVSVAEPPERAAGADPVDTAWRRDELFAALRKLPSGQRAMVVLRYWLDMSEVETAEVMGCSVGTVKSQASHGIRRLRGLLTVDERPFDFEQAPDHVLERNGESR